MLRECSPDTMCHASCVMYYVSHVTCHIYIYIFFYFQLIEEKKVVEPVGEGSVINKAYPI